jgi:integrase
MEWCIAQEHIGANPVKSVSSLLPKQPGKRERATRFPALPWQQVREFVTGTLHSDTPSLSAVMLEFLILTAARSGEVRAMEWEEVDFDVAIWTVPASRMKAKVEHRVPLSDRALAILKAQREKADHPTLVFPSVRGKVTTDMILTKFLRDKKVPSDVKGRCATAHGFRSSFRNWASENGYSQEAAERALAHTIKNSAEWSYHRTDLLDQRRIMMQGWADFLVGRGVTRSNVTSLQSAARKK